MTKWELHSYKELESLWELWKKSILALSSTPTPCVWGPRLCLTGGSLGLQLIEVLNERCIQYQASKYVPGLWCSVDFFLEKPTFLNETTEEYYFYPHSLPKKVFIFELVLKFGKVPFPYRFLSPLAQVYVFSNNTHCPLDWNVIAPCIDQRSRSWTQAQWSVHVGFTFYVYKQKRWGSCAQGASG